MHRPRHRPRSSARLYFSLLSVLALVAFACLPALAQAECTDSSCAQYEVEIPTAEGKPKKNGKGADHGSGEPQANASKNGGGENGGSPSGEEEGSEETEESKGGGAPGKDNGGGNSGDKSGAPDGGGSKGKESLDGSQAVEGPTQQGKAASSSDDGGGSSPLVPILIAVAVLAAISIGAVIYRQRRQGGDGSGSPVSPKAG